MKWPAGPIAVMVLVAACGRGADGAARVAEPVTSTRPSASSSDPARTPPSLAPMGDEAPFTWPDPKGPPPWRSIPLGLPGTTHLRVTHGPLGFLSINNVSRGAVVRTSRDGSSWQETAVLEGPHGEEQVSVADLLITETEYLVVGETWTNTATGSEGFRDVLWRSPDAISWEAIPLDRLAPGTKASELVSSSLGLVLAGTIHDPRTGTASPRLWLEQREGGFADLTSSIPELDEEGWIEGAATDGEGLLIWGTATDDTAFIWRTSDFEIWTTGVIGEGSFGHIQSISRLGDRWIAVGSSSAWVSEDAIGWRRTATPDDFATDAASEGFAGYGRLHRQGQYAVTVASVGYRSGVAWCYEDRSDCGHRVPTVLVTPNGREWRRLPLPGDHPQPGHPIEAHGFLVDGRLSVVHSVGDEAMLSILKEVENAVPVTNGERPDLPFEVVGPGDQIEPGVEYGYPVWTHCGLPAIGPLNGVHWVVDPESVASVEGVPGWGGTVLGFIILTDDDEIEYRVDGRVVARYVPDPEHQPVLCY